MAKLSTRGPATRDAIRNLTPFTTHGALSGKAYGEPTAHGVRYSMGPWDSGRLSGADLDNYRQDMAAIDYAVFSYSTPIAWHTSEGWYRVGQRFSVTTSKHQGMCPVGKV